MITHYIEYNTASHEGSIGWTNSVLLNRLHGFMRHHNINLGIGLPKYSINCLGGIVRVFGTKEQITLLASNEHIIKGNEHYDISDITALTDEQASAEHVQFKIVRSQPSNIEGEIARRMRRHLKRNGREMDEDAVNNLRLHLINKSRPLPFFTVHRENKKHILLIEKIEAQSKGDGSFNSYGFSSGGTTPNF